jgi:hypothetical protein
MKSLLKILFIALLSLILLSCGSRKVQKSTEVQKEVTTEATKIVEVKTDNTKINIVENCDETIIEPIDTIAPMVVDGKVYKNARLRRVNKKVNTNIVKDVKQVKTTVKQAKKKTSQETIKKDIQSQWILKEASSLHHNKDAKLHAKFILLAFALLKFSYQKASFLTYFHWFYKLSRKMLCFFYLVVICLILLLLNLN